MRHARTIAWALAAASMVVAAAAFSACANSAADCAKLGKPAGCDGTGTGGSTGGGGTATTSSSTSSTGGGGTTTTSSSTGGTGGAPALAVIPACSGAGAVKHWGDGADQAARALALAGSDAILAGDFQGPLDFGAGALDPQNGATFVARLDTSLSPTWNSAFDAAFKALAADGQGRIFVAGDLSGTGPVNFSDCPALDPTTAKFVVVGLSATNNCLFASPFDTTVTRVSLIADGQGGVVIAAGFTGMTTFGTKTLTSAGGQDILLARLDGAGAVTWARAFGGTNDDVPAGVALDAASNAVAVGTFEGVIDFGTGAVAATPNGQTGVFALGLKSGGIAQWSRSFVSAADAAAGAAVAVGVAPLPSGVAVGGVFTGDIDVGAASPLATGTTAAFVVRLDASGETVSTPAAIHGIAAGEIDTITVGPAAEVVLAGARAGGMYVARVGADGTIFEALAAGAGRATGAAYLGTGKLLLGGHFSGSLATSATGTINSNGGDDVLLFQACLP